MNIITKSILTITAFIGIGSVEASAIAPISVPELNTNKAIFSSYSEFGDVFSLVDGDKKLIGYVNLKNHRDDDLPPPPPRHHRHNPPPPPPHHGHNPPPPPCRHGHCPPPPPPPCRHGHCPPPPPPPCRHGHCAPPPPPRY